MPHVSTDGLVRGFPNSKKIYRSSKNYPNLKVPFRQIQLTNGSHFVAYDTSGPYTDPEISTRIEEGLSPHRGAWIEKRGDSEIHGNAKRACPGKNVTQLHYARKGIITPEMKYVSIRESEYSELEYSPEYFKPGYSEDPTRLSITPEFVRREIAEGRAILPGTQDPWALERTSSPEGYLSGTMAMIIILNNPSLLN